MQLLVKEFVKLLQKEIAMTKENTKDLEKQRAEFAYDCVDEFLKKNEELKKIKKEIGEKKINCQKNQDNQLCKKKKELEIYSSPSEYKSYVKKIPTLIQTNGLSATFAFMYSKKKTYLAIYKQVQKWLEKRGFEINEELVKWMISQPSSEYRHITNEVMALFLWLRRFAEGRIEKGNENGEEKEEK